MSANLQHARARDTARTIPQDTGAPVTDELPELFVAAFMQSRNAMVLVDNRRRVLEANGAYLHLLGYGRDEIIGRPIYRFVVDGAMASPAEWKSMLASGRFTGETQLVCADGGRAAVQWAATTEIVTGRQLILVVALSTSRWGAHFRRGASPGTKPATLSVREREIVQLVASGSTGREIADELHISHDTVRTHVRNAMIKIDARSRAHLVAKSLGDGLILGPRGTGSDPEHRVDVITGSEQ
jgi:PAS domain S-box-containing protein